MLPVDVVIPTLGKRNWFLNRFVLPALRAQQPSTITVLDGPEGACQKRNRGAMQGESKYIFFCDDDVIVGDDYLQEAIRAIERGPDEVSYTYANWIQVPLPGCMDAPLTTAQYVVTPQFKDIALYNRGGVDMIVVRRDRFLPFDESLPRFQTWDWALSMKAKGWIGVRVGEQPMYVSFMLDRGITTGTPADASAKAREYILRKHGIAP